MTQEGSTTKGPKGPVLRVIMDEKLRPAHYNEFNIPFVKAAGYLKGFCLGNAIKYLDRAGKKEGESEELDLRKAITYLEIYLNEKEEV